MKKRQLNEIILKNIPLKIKRYVYKLTQNFNFGKFESDTISKRFQFNSFIIFVRKFL